MRDNAGVFRVFFRTTTGSIVLSCDFCSQSIHSVADGIVAAMCRVRNHVCVCAAERQVLPVAIPGTVIIDGTPMLAEVDHIHRRMIIAVA